MKAEVTLLRVNIHFTSVDPEPRLDGRTDLLLLLSAFSQAGLPTCCVLYLPPLESQTSLKTLFEQ